MELRCKVQNYEWGKLGKTSTVAKLQASADSNFIIEDNEPYAELWMGTHPNGPAVIVERDILLSEYLKTNADAIGPDVRKQFGVAVPFLLKVLSIRKALSIQAHPNKSHAEVLHAQFPQLYKDPNHKPELAVALTPFEALCGFRPFDEIIYFIKNIPEMQAVLSKEAVDQVLSAETGDCGILKAVFSSLMTCDKEIIAHNLNALSTRLDSEGAEVQSKLQHSLLSRLRSDFPGDVGCFSIYLLNYLRLRPGQAVFLAPNLPHAYLSGDCIECMACSDNVVRAGLTPKYMDVATLLEMLDYGSYTAEQLNFTPHLEDEYSAIWRPPVPDFALVKIVLPSGSPPHNTRTRPSPSILLVVSGTGTACDSEPVPLRPGMSLFLKASRQLTITPTEDLLIYQAVCNVL